MIGQVLDERYRVLSHLGAGSMGDVFLVEHIALGRKEALKVLPLDLATSETFVARFRREARATNRVQHPNIVAVHDFGRLPDGRFFLSMEYADGVRLDELIRRDGALEIIRALSLFEQLCRAVGHAHRCGVIHRDIKPSNIVVCEEPGGGSILKVLDFGISKIIAPDYEESMRLTRDGDVLGTFSYMAPEQFQGVGNEPRSDIYAIGCIAYEMLTGHPAFRGRSTTELMNAHAKGLARRPRDIRAEIPKEIDDLVVQCLHKVPERRFPSAEVIASLLASLPGYGSAGETLIASSMDDPLEEAAAFEPTDVGRPPGPPPGLAATANTSVADARAQLAGEILGLAEAVLDAGHNHALLVMTMDDVRRARDKVENVRAELTALEARKKTLEQDTREREGSLRFAIGELRFDRGQRAEAGEPPHEDLDFQIGELEKRLLETEAELSEKSAEVAAEGEALTTKQAKADAGLAEAFRKLESVLSDILPKLESEPDIKVWADRVKTAQSILTRAR